jgi:hypothetical protein
MNPLFSLEKTALGNIVTQARKLDISDFDVSPSVSYYLGERYKIARHGILAKLKQELIDEILTFTEATPENFRGVSRNIYGLSGLIDKGNGVLTSHLFRAGKVIEFNYRGLRSADAKVKKLEKAQLLVKEVFTQGSEKLIIELLKNVNSIVASLVSSMSDEVYESMKSCIVELQVDEGILAQNLSLIETAWINTIKETNDSLEKRIKDLRDEIEGNYEAVYNTKRAVVERLILDGAGKQTKEFVASLATQKKSMRRRMILN